MTGEEAQDYVYRLRVQLKRQGFNVDALGPEDLMARYVLKELQICTLLRDVFCRTPRVLRCMPEYRICGWNPGL